MWPRCWASMPIPLSATSTHQALTILDADTRIRGGVPAATNLSPLATRFWMTCRKSGRIAGDHRQGFVLHRPARRGQLGLQGDHHLVDHPVEGHRHVEPALGADLGVGQQVVDQHVHAGGAAQDEGQELLAPLVEQPALGLLQEAGEPGDDLQGGLEVVGGDGGELGQLGVGAGQLLLVALPQLLRPGAVDLGLLAIGDVVRVADEAGRRPVTSGGAATTSTRSTRCGRRRGRTGARPGGARRRRPAAAAGAPAGGRRRPGG